MSNAQWTDSQIFQVMPIHCSFTSQIFSRIPDVSKAILILEFIKYLKSTSKRKKATLHVLFMFLIIALNFRKYDKKFKYFTKVNFREFFKSTYLYRNLKFINFKDIYFYS